jgi:Domain of unknown function (DUF4397)
MDRRGALGVRAGILGVCLCVLSGCGGSSSSENGNLRFLQGSPDAPQVNLLVDGKSVATNIGYINATGYVSVKSGSRHVQVVPVSGASPVLDANVTINASGNQTLIISGPVASIHNVLLTDGGTTATTGDAHVRVVNASSSMGTADVYIVPSGTSIAGIPPTVANLAFNSDTGYQLVPVGAYEVFMTAPQTKNAFLSTGPINLAASANQTVVGLDDPSGSGFTFTVLTDQ